MLYWLFIVMAQPIGFLLTCGPFVVLIAAWVRVLMTGRKGWPPTAGWVALGFVSANAIVSAALFLYFLWRPVPSLPPWKDPETLGFGVLLLPVLIGMLLGLMAAIRSSPRCLVVVIEVVSLPLLLVSFFAVGSV